jgi:7,8-dihydropterin-6-yl-methyl-4-(beta-D-ribofuranosyl)aminobenzene 5'-phosphate synthase
MKITIIYDNKTLRNDLVADWGFACLVEVHGRTILFDTGARGNILISNLKQLNFALTSIDDVVISHAHWDHTGGLSEFLSRNKDVRLFVPASLAIGDGAAREVIYIKESAPISEHIYSTGELIGMEQSLVVDTDKGLVVVVGCSHPGVKEILNTASEYGTLYALIGGLHGFSQFEAVKNLGLICATHCTQHTKQIGTLFSDVFVEGGAGQIIEI